MLLVATLGVLDTTTLDSIDTSHISLGLVFVKKIAVDIKLIGKAGTEEEVNSIKEDLERLYKWTEEWQMKFNADKCKVHLHVHSLR